MPLSKTSIILFKNIKALYKSSGLSKVNYAYNIKVSVQRLERILNMDSKALRVDDIDNICEYHQIKIRTLIVEDFY